MSIPKLVCYSVGGALFASAAAAFGGIGVVAGGAAVGLSALEVAFIGGGAGTTIYKLRHDQATARRKVVAADRTQRTALKQQEDLTTKIAAARKVLDDLEDVNTPPSTKSTRFVDPIGTIDRV